MVIRRAAQNDAPAIKATQTLESTTGVRAADKSQDAIILAPADARLVVEAGPGYGKTDVACARVARLLKLGIPPTRILLLSFTRTAVREMRNRIAQLADDGTSTPGVSVRTVDSFARQLWGAYIGGRPTGTFDAGIQSVLDVLSDPGDDEYERVVQALGAQFAHVFVDEA